MIKRVVHLTYKAARRIVVGVVGATVLVLGIVMIVTPGPGLVVIPLGLTILATEFPAARRLLARLRRGAADAAGRLGRALDRARRRPRAR